MKLSFVIPAHNEEAVIGQCLDSILGELRGKPYEFEIIVVNNASADRTKKVALAHPHVRVIDEPKKGITRARQAGFLAATGDLIANIDADTLLPPGWIEKVMSEFSNHPHLVCLSGPLIYYDLPLWVRALVKTFYGLGFIFYRINHFLRIGSLVQGGNFVVRRRALEKVGGFNTDIDFYGEDTDVARRLVKLGQAKFTFGLPIYASGRRLTKEGILRTGIRYTMNYFWITFSGKPFHTSSVDIREGERKT